MNHQFKARLASSNGSLDKARKLVADLDQIVRDAKADWATYGVPNSIAPTRMQYEFLLVEKKRLVEGLRRTLDALDKTIARYG